jgi:hypothetical protein
MALQALRLFNRPKKVAKKKRAKKKAAKKAARKVLVNPWASYMSRPAKKRRKTMAKKRRVKRTAKKSVAARKVAAPKRRRRKAVAKKRVTKRRVAARKVAAPKRRWRVKTSKQTLKLKRGPRKGLAKYKMRRHHRTTKKSGALYTYSVKKINPNIKEILMSGVGLFAGIRGSKVLSNLITKYFLTEKAPAATAGWGADTAAKQEGLPPWAKALLPSVACAAAAVYLVPRVVKNQNVAKSIQLGAVVALFDTLLDKVILPQLPDKDEKTGEPTIWAGMKPMLQGYGADNFSVHPVLANYVQGPGLSEYTQGVGGYGEFEVSEALSFGETDFIEKGGAAGAFSKTAFSGSFGGQS